MMRSEGLDLAVAVELWCWVVEGQAHSACERYQHLPLRFAGLQSVQTPRGREGWRGRERERERERRVNSEDFQRTSNKEMGTIL